MLAKFVKSARVLERTGRSKKYEEGLRNAVALILQVESRRCQVNTAATEHEQVHLRTGSFKLMIELSSLRDIL